MKEWGGVQDWRSEGVMEENRSSTTTWKIINIFQVNKRISKVV